MKRLLLASCAFVSLARIGYAADLPVKPLMPFKALPVVACTPSVCSGFYWGFNVAGIGTNLNVIGNGINGSVFAAGFGVGGQAGYQLWNGQWFFAGEVAVDYMTNPPAAGAIGGNTGHFRSTELVKIGTPIANLLSLNTTTPPVPAPSQGPILPANLLANITSPYVIVGPGQKWGDVNERNALVSGAGVQAALASGWNLSLEYQNWQYGNHDVSGTVSQSSENIVWLKLNNMF